MAIYAWLTMMCGAAVLMSSPQSYGTIYLSNEFDRRKIGVGTAGLVLSLFALGKMAAFTLFIPLASRVGRR